MNSTVKNKEKLQNTKKIKDIVKRFSIFTLSLIFLFSSFVYADTLNYSSLSITYPSGATNSTKTNLIRSNNFIAYYEGSAPYYYATYSFTDNNIPVYYFVVNRDLYVAYDNQYTDNYYSQGVYNNNTSPLTAKSISSVSTDYSLNYEMLLTLGNSYTINVMSFTSLDSALQNVRQTINSNNIRYPYTFQNGYLFVYDLGNSGTMYSFDLTSKSEEYSNLGEYPFPDTNQSYWFSNSLPEIDETTIPDSNATIIHWLKGNKQNIFGQTQDMIATISGSSTGRYLYIYNPPAHYKWVGSSNPTASETINYPVTINGVSTGDNFYIYDSVARLADYNQGGKVQGTVGNVGYGSVASDGAITVTTSDGEIYNQVSGGSTDISGANGGSIAENINGLKQTLDDFVNQFIQLLSAPISHIQQLIQSSHQFFDVFSQLFEWLPSELSSVIVSGLIIMVVIGVIKMLL